MKDASGMNLAGFFRSEKGGGESVRATLRALEAAGIPFALNDFIEPGSANREPMRHAFSGDNPYPVNVYQGDPFGFADFARQRGPSYFEGRFNVGFFNWEAEEFPESLLPVLERFDELWAPSRFVQDCLARVARVPVTRIPLSVVAEPASRMLDRKTLGIEKHVKVFLFIFDFASGLTRKNPLGLISAFCAAFGESRDVLLLLKTSRAELYPDQAAIVQSAMVGAPNIRLFNANVTRPEIASLLELCDAYVSLHRGEGFGFTLAEAMLRGKPVVSTAYSSTTDFTDVGNSFPVAFERVEIAENDGPYQKGNIWAEPSLEHAAAQMSAMAKDWPRAEKIGMKGKHDIERWFSPLYVGGLIRRRLDLIGSAQKVPA